MTGQIETVLTRARDLVARPEWHKLGSVSIQRDGVETYIAAAVSPDLWMSLDLQRAEDGQPRRTLDLDDIPADKAREIGQLLIAGADFIDNARAARGQMRLRLVSDRSAA